MGGYGSGKKVWRKLTVEECLSIKMKNLIKAGTWCDGQAGNITWTWHNGDGEAKIGFRFEIGMGLHRLWLSYTLTDSTGKQCSYNYPVNLEGEPCRFGGKQWYFRCPGDGCGRRVRQLHKPRDSHLFACRNCHDLTYRSVQEHDNRIKRLREDPEALERAIHGSRREQLLAMKALR